MKHLVLYKHLKDVFFALFLRPCQRVEKGNIVWKKHLALELTCQLRFLALLKTTCQWPHWNVFTKASRGCCRWACYRNCPWNKSEYSQEACSLLLGRWAKRWSEKSIMKAVFFNRIHIRAGQYVNRLCIDIDLDRVILCCLFLVLKAALQWSGLIFWIYHTVLLVLILVYTHLRLTHITVFFTLRHHNFLSCNPG